MKSVISWLLATVLAFGAAAGAFLLLANLSDTPAERSLSPGSEPAGPVPELQLRLDKGQLASLEGAPDQELSLTVANTSEKDFSNVNVSLEVSSENTAISETRYYRESLEELAAGQSTTLMFNVNLSPIEGSEKSSVIARNLDSRRTIVEIRAATPGGSLAVKTAILSLE